MKSGPFSDQVKENAPGFVHFKRSAATSGEHLERNASEAVVAKLGMGSYAPESASHRPDWLAGRERPDCIDPPCPCVPGAMQHARSGSRSRFAMCSPRAWCIA